MKTNNTNNTNNKVGATDTFIAATYRTMANRRSFCVKKTDVLETIKNEFPEYIEHVKNVNKTGKIKTYNDAVQQAYAVYVSYFSDKIAPTFSKYFKSCENDPKYVTVV